MKPYHETDKGVLYLGNSLEILKQLPNNSVDSIVTDPPYGLSFMGKKWDYDVPSVEIWQECLRVLKPGGHLLAFAGTRTQHRMAVRIEDAGFEIRDMIAWIYGSGFPKSLNIGKAVDKINGVEITELPTLPMQDATDIGAISKNRRCAICGKAISSGSPCQCDRQYHSQNEFEGWGTSLKPALEPITVARKPISESNIAENCLKHGTGGINIDGCRVGTEDTLSFGSRELGDGIKYGKCKPTTEGIQHTQGRFPANLIHDGSDEVMAVFPETKSGALNAGHKRGETEFYGGGIIQKDYGNDSGSAARFFYCAKASKSERDAGLNDMQEKSIVTFATANGTSGKPSSISEGRETAYKNNHPTVKPIAVMQWLLRLVTPKNGITLDPFSGSGSTQCAAIREGFRYIGIEISEEYLAIAAKRIDSELQQTEIEL